MNVQNFIFVKWSCTWTNAYALMKKSSWPTPITAICGGVGVFFCNIRQGMDVPSIWGNYAQKWGLAGRPEKGNFTVIHFLHANHPGHIK